MAKNKFSMDLKTKVPEKFDDIYELGEQKKGSKGDRSMCWMCIKLRESLDASTTSTTSLKKQKVLEGGVKENPPESCYKTPKVVDVVDTPNVEDGPQYQEFRKNTLALLEADLGEIGRMILVDKLVKKGYHKEQVPELLRTMVLNGDIVETDHTYLIKENGE